MITDIGNIQRTGLDNKIPLYIGSGSFGGCFAITGLQPYALKSTRYGETVFMHEDAWHRGVYGLDYHTPVGRLAWKTLTAADVKGVTQEQILSNGSIRTELSTDTADIDLTAWFHPYKRDVFSLLIKWNGQLPSIQYLIQDRLCTHYGEYINARLELEQYVNAQSVDTLYTAGNAKVSVDFRVINTQGTAFLRFDNGSVELSSDSESGEALLLIGMASPLRADELCDELSSVNDIRAHIAESAESWRVRWGADIPNAEGEEWAPLYYRCIFYMLASYGTSKFAIAPPNGWSGVGWTFHFPQDFGFIFPLFLELGYTDIAKAKLSVYRRTIPEMRDYTRRVYNKDGVMWAWIYPIGPDSKILPCGAPNHCHYEIHNAVYPAQMAYTLSEKLNDREYALSVAWPIVHESARFFASAVTQEPNGKWSVCVTPSMGGDEFGKLDSKNYICALYSAKYTFTLALNMAKKYEILSIDNEIAFWKQVLSDGLAFDQLENERLGIYQTTPDLDFRMGLMKHPIELLPYSFLPADEKNIWEQNAYQKRYELCTRSDRNFFHGWTLMDIMLSEVNNNDYAAFEESCKRLIPSSDADKDLIQLFETCSPEYDDDSSKARPDYYYVTSMGIFALAATRYLNGCK